jgi:hypothetical protein
MLVKRGNPSLGSFVVSGQVAFIKEVKKTLRISAARYLWHFMG